MVNLVVELEKSAPFQWGDVDVQQPWDNLDPYPIGMTHHLSHMRHPLDPNMIDQTTN